MAGDGGPISIAVNGEVLTISPRLIGGIKMQRDMEMIKKVLLAVQARKDLHREELSIEGEDDFTVRYHVEMLYDAGFVDGSAKYFDMPYKTVLVKDLSWAGHDFVAVLANDTVWNKIKSSFSASDLATLPLSMIKVAGTALLEQYVKQKVGL